VIYGDDKLPIYVLKAAHVVPLFAFWLLVVLLAHESYQSTEAVRRLEAVAEFRVQV
jgi:hypothetical protein